MAKQMGEDAKYVHSGCFEILMTKDECLWGKALVELQRGQGYGPDQIDYLDRDQARKIEPHLGDDVLGVVYFPDEGHVNPKRFTQSIGVMAKGAGADIWMNHEVEGLKFADGKYQAQVRSNLDQMSSDFIAAEHVVFASGAHSHHLLEPFGLTLPIIPVRGTMWSTSSLPQGQIKHVMLAGESHSYWHLNNAKLRQRGLPGSITHPSMWSKERLTRHLYGKQTHDGCIIFGGDRKVETIGAKADSPIQQESITDNKNHIHEFLPFVKGHKVERSWTGLMPFTLDNVPVIGKIDALPGKAYIISGLASGGMMQGPGSGQLLADLILGCPSAAKILAPADPNRFDLKLNKMAKL